MRNSATECPAHLHRKMADMVRHFRQERRQRPINVHVTKIGVAHQGRDPETPGGHERARRARDPVDVHKMAGPRKTGRHDRHQTLPARDDARLVTMTRKNGERILDARRRMVIEWGGFHRWLRVIVNGGTVRGPGSSAQGSIVRRSRLTRSFSGLSWRRGHRGAVAGRSINGSNPRPDRPRPDRSCRLSRGFQIVSSVQDTMRVARS